MIRLIVNLPLMFLSVALASSAYAQTAPSADATAAAADAFRAEQYPQAVALFRKIVTADPNNAAAWHFLGQSLEKTHDLLGARKAYQQAIAADPGGKVAERTRPMLDKLPLPDATKIQLPSGLTLFDWMTLNAKKPPSAPLDMLKETNSYIRDDGPYPELLQIRYAALQALIAKVDVGAADSARSSMPLIGELKSVAGDDPAVLALSARAEHVTGDYAAAKIDYGKWLQLAKADALNRENIAENLLRAGQSQPPTALRPSWSLSEAAWKKIEALDLYRNAPRGKSMTITWERRYEPGSLSRNYGNERARAGQATKVITALGIPGCFHVQDQEEFFGGALPVGGEYCGGGFLRDGGDVDVTGSIFPLKIGATMTVTRKVSADLSEIDRITVTGKVAAKTISPAWEGDAWEIKSHVENTGVGKGLKSDFDDFFIEQIGLPLSVIGYQYMESVGSTSRYKSVLPPEGAVYHIVNGDKLSFTNVHIEIH